MASSSGDAGTSELMRDIAMLRRQLSSSSPSTPGALASFASSPLLSPSTRQQYTDPPVILDIGARGIRAGIAGLERPVCELPIGPDPRGRIKTHVLWDVDMRNTEMEDFHDILQAILRDVYYKYLLLDGKSRKVVILENPMMTLQLKKAIAFVLFNYFQSISVTYMLSPVCSMLAAGARTALVVDIGWHETTVTPIYDYKPLLFAVKSTLRAGEQLHDLVSGALKGFTDVLPSFDEVEEFIARAMYCTRIDEITSSTSQQAFAITLSGNTYYVPSSETRYSPLVQCFIQRAADNADDIDCFPIPDLIVSCLSGLGVDTRASMLSRIVFVGGCSNIPGLKLRILEEVRNCLVYDANSGHSIELQKNFRPWTIGDRSRIKGITSLGAWSGASLYISRERDYLLNGGGGGAGQRAIRRIRVETASGISHTTSSSFRILGEVERDKFLQDEIYADNIFDWTVPTKYA
ncbi:actin-domain-containing protein [Lipomyces chichibuensis]|uniref:actin-domain-containing protein n=1 Tax=Lipomyces chichibuensis TaxID=1546026 RepID=UPI003343989A